MRSTDPNTGPGGTVDARTARPLDAGGLALTYALEWAGILLVGLANNGAGFDVAFGLVQ